MPCLRPPACTLPRPPPAARRPPPAARRQCTVSYTLYPGAHDHAGDQQVPHVRLSGLWLEQLGFAIGTKLRITASEGQVLIEVLAPVEVPLQPRRARR
ncbi:SymE family type I addiction module toxin [Xanthomonas hortorum]|uniref:SymE family type I addiction module toxin n=1 Tax=Xanthomonas hortorum TaxID=56454 RepID=UPI003CCEFB37